jgi:hypothetical protein
MSNTSFHALGVVFITGSVLLLGLGEYYRYLMRREISSRVPESRWNWLLVWISTAQMQGFYFPDNQTRKKYYFSTFGMIICVGLGIRFLMK